METIFLMVSVSVSVLSAQTTPKAVRGALAASAKKPVIQATHRLFSNSRWKISSQLSKLAKRTFNQAHQLEEALRQETELAFLQRSQATAHIVPAPDMIMLSELYPQLKGLIRNKYQFGDYFISQNNLQIIEHSEDEIAHLLLMQKNIDHLKATQVHTPEILNREMEWLIQEIPTDTEYLLLGEIHDVPEIHQQLALLAPKLRQKFGNRPIIWLTEFLPEFFLANTLTEEFKKQITPSLIHLWDKLQAENISVMGIEQIAVFTQDAHLYRSLKTFRHTRISMWETFEGVRLRNQFWEEEISKIRRRNPDALIIVHSGFGHVDYTLPNSVGTFLQQKGRTFTVSLIPGFPPNYISKLNQVLRESNILTPLPCPPNGFAPFSYFDFVTRGNFPQQALEFGPGDWYITGFDVQLKLPAQPNGL